jgi:hypothetical protein
VKDVKVLKNLKQVLMLVLCISEKWGIKSLKFKHLILLLTGKIRLPQKGKEYYVKGCAHNSVKIYYKLEGYPDDMAFRSTKFTYSDANTNIFNQITESLIQE